MVCAAQWTCGGTCANAPFRTPTSTRLDSEPFRNRDGVAHGITLKRLRGQDLDRAVWGVRRIPRPGEIEFLERCRSFAVRMPSGAFFSHSTAALLLGVPLPYRLERENRLHIGLPTPVRAPHASGIIGHRLDLSPDHLVATRGLVHTSPARTWCDLASLLNLYELVAAGDFLAHWKLPSATVPDLRRTSRSFVGRRGMATIREALPLLNNRSESPPESVLRVILAQAGLPSPRINHEIVLTEDGSVVRTDLAFDKKRVLIEYQGDYHRKKTDQWRKDMTRRSRLEAQGWIVIELNANDLKDPNELVARIRLFLARHG
jgi:very-short-patch-repair endonuclease